MNTVPRFPKSVLGFVLFAIAILLPRSGAAQATLAVVPASVSVQTNVGTNAPSQTVQVKKTGAGALRWTVVQAAAPWVTVSPTSGTNNVTLTLTFQTSGLPVQAQPYTTSFRVVSGTQSVTVNVAVTIVAVTPPPPPTLTITCPANMSVSSPNGSPVVVTYTVATSGGNAPVNLTVTPPSGSSFAVGTTTVQANALSADGQTKSCSFTVTVTGPTPAPTLTITCPANISVASSDGSPVVVSYTVTTSGGNPPVTLTVTPTSGSSFAVGTTTVQANGQSQDGQTKSCSFTVTVTPPSSDWTFCAVEGGFCAFTGTQQVRYGANGSYFYQTLSGGTACTNSVFGDPIVGVAKQCAIPASAVLNEWTFCASENQTCAFTGTREVRYGANGSYAYLLLSNGTPCTNNVFGDPISGTVKHCDIKATAPPATSYGPRPTITCPAGAVDILPGQSIQLIVNANAAGTTFCLRAGVHQVTSSIRPQTGDIFVGEYGAVLDGTGWTTADGTQGAFRVYDDPNDPNDPNDPVDYVTIRNLVIRNMPQYGIHAYLMPNHWTIEYNEIASNKYGLLFGPDFTIRNNYIHNNIGTPGSTAQLGGGYGGVHADNTTIDSNEIAYNGSEQKVVFSANVTFRNNFVHHNAADGIWYDTNPNAGAVIEGNRVEDNGRNGIFFEASIGATIRNNTVRRHTTWDAVMISMSQNAQIYNNTLEANYGGIDYFLNCAVLSGGDDVKNNAAYDNTVVVGTQSDTYASGFFSIFSCTSTQLAPYLNGSKNLTFSRNAYRVPSLSFTRYFFWGGWKDWNQWQAMGQDVGGSLSQ